MNEVPMIPKKYQTRSFTSIYDILTPQPYKNSQNIKNTIPVLQSSCKSKHIKTYDKEKSILFNETPYVTCENYHVLYKNTSNKSIVRSTSTLFYDLDKLVKRHSYHCMTEGPVAKKEKLKTKDDKYYKSGFGAKSEAIVQECETQMLPKLRIRDSKQTIAKKIKKAHVNEPTLSSDTFLSDDYIHKRFNYTQKDPRLQKYWSYAKYRTEFTNPLSEKKKKCKKDCGKRTEDPCPCQLFSYACPCTNKKSLTELAKSIKTLTVAQQITGTSNLLIAEDEVPNSNKVKQSRGNDYYEEKPTNTDILEYSNRYEVVTASEGPLPEFAKKIESSKVIDKNSYIQNNTKTTSKSRKKSKQIVCPNCNEKLEVLSSTEEEYVIKSRNSPACRNHEFIPPIDNININVPNDIETCNHNPHCELIPICQILPIDNIYLNTKCTNKFSMARHNSKSIRITKACRHHPPCILVPSCQRLNVLNNNCEFIPPCLHRPRCVNLPLCVPFSKSLNYEELVSKNTDEIDTSEYSRNPRYKYFPGRQHDSLNHNINQQFQSTQNTCEYVSDYTPRFILNPELAGVIPATFSPGKLRSSRPCRCCQSNKSCQYDCIDCKCTSSLKQRVRSANSDAVIYIRDVGCQFRYKNYSPRDSMVRSKNSSASFNLNTSKAANYYTNYHTLRYEDKYTNPISGEELSMSTLTTSSLEIDVHCPSHGKQAKGTRNSGFSPISTSPFVGAFTTHVNPYSAENEHISKSSTRTRLNTYPTKSRRSFLQKKTKKIFSVRRRRKSRANHISYPSSRRLPLILKTNMF